MTSSKSNSWLVRAVVVLVALVLAGGVANAGRKRLVVLDWEGDDAEKLQSSFVKFLKKSHTVVSIEKWNTAAEEAGATKVNEKNIKKVAKKLKVDGLISASVEKRRDEYIIRLKLRSGSKGSLVGSQINIKTDGTKLSKTAKTDVEDELFGVIDSLESVRGGGDDEEEEEEKPKKDEEEEEKPSKFKSGKMDKEEEEEKPAKLSKKEEAQKKKEEEAAKKEEEKRKKEEEKLAKAEEEKRKKDEKAKKDKENKEEKEALATKKDKKDDEEEEEEEESPLPKPKKGDKKRTAKADEEEDEIEESFESGSGDKAAKQSPGNRAIDVVAGLSLNMRRLSFTYAPTVGVRPAGYKGSPVPGAMFDLVVYPMAFTTQEGQLKNIGVTAMYDRVLLVKSKDQMGKELESAQERYAIGIQYRYPFNKSASSPVLGARVRYGRQLFKIAAGSPLPNVNYTMIDPGLFFRMPVGKKLVLDANAAFLAITNTGQMQNMDKYGAATVSGLEFAVGADYGLTDKIFLRGLLNIETIGYKFKGTGMQTEGGKVSGARDSYYGVNITAGYLF